MSDTSNIKPDQVTSANWAELKASGFKHLSNVEWPIEQRVSFGEYCQIMKRELGEENFLLGEPANTSGDTDALIENANALIGVYVRTKHETDKVMKF